MAQHRERRRVRAVLPLQRLVLSDQGLAAHLLARSARWTDRGRGGAGPGRRGDRVERDDRRGQSRHDPVAAGRGGWRGALVRSNRRFWGEPDAVGRGTATFGIQRKDGGTRYRIRAGLHDLLYAALGGGMFSSSMRERHSVGGTERESRRLAPSAQLASRVRPCSRSHAVGGEGVEGSASARRDGVEAIGSGCPRPPFSPWGNAS